MCPCVVFAKISKRQQRQSNSSFHSGSETRLTELSPRGGTPLRQPARVEILGVTCASTPPHVLVTVQEGANCSSTWGHILSFHPWMHMLNVILAVVHVCFKHLAHYISPGKTCVLVVSQSHSSHYYVGNNSVLLAQVEDFKGCFAIQFEFDFSGLKAAT